MLLETERVVPGGAECRRSWMTLYSHLEEHSRAIYPGLRMVAFGGLRGNLAGSRFESYSRAPRPPSC